MALTALTASSLDFFLASARSWVRYVVVCKGELDDSRISAESLSDEVPLDKMVEMNVLSAADRVLVKEKRSFLSVDLMLPAKASPADCSSSVARTCSAPIALLSSTLLVIPDGKVCRGMLYHSGLGSTSW